MKGSDQPPRNKLLPLYWARMYCLPAASAVVVKLAWPAPFTGAVPNSVFPSKKVTVPIGEPEKAGLTVAVKVTG